MSELKPFDDKLAALIANLSPAGRRKMAGEIAKKLRTRQQQRIKTQKDPDGKPYAARKRQPVRSKKGRIKREMFAKLRTNRYMKATGSDEAAVVEFVGKVQRLVRVHQEGLEDKPNSHAQSVKYPKRQLLGFAFSEIVKIESVIIEVLT
ncbi:phage virion morphogenesis protein [Enterobacter sp. Ap-1006]|uniref:phage virion morphogenesis protein n=1 Tax=Enterobacter sp. Ap-1006 TaxID=2608345 RepID=UPI0014235068|nr:phage virion morphogenesis protein [Enterobacter sp. Ap-1006]NIF50099.1 phage virion morphogenesis protein [Enterobacter sp. Ap-1006]